MTEATSGAGDAVIEQAQCAAHNRPMVSSDWCGFYVPELGVSEDYGCWIDEGTDRGI